MAAVAGCIVGLLGGAFRWCLEQAVEFREWLDGAAVAGSADWLVPVTLTAAGAAAACAIARCVPQAAGSGIQHVQAVWLEEGHARSLWLLPAKFVGGVIAIGSGLVLGREGPTVHMGATIGAEAGRRAGLDPDDVRRVHTALGGAGLAVAFTAPLAGVIFVCEEVTRTVRPRMVLLTLIGTVTAVACARLLVDDVQAFPYSPPPAPAGWLLPLFLLFGVVMGAVGAAYSALVVGMLAVCDRLTDVPPVVRAAAIGALVGLLLALDPLLVGDGDPLSEQLLDGQGPAVAVLAGYLVVRFAAGPLSYAAATPGGLFAPLLALGALCGALAHAAAAPLLPVPGSGAFAVVGMAALFAGVVRAPVTGTVLVIEMTGATSLLLPLLAASFAATLTANLLESDPIYDTLRHRMLERP
ncbi:chloride channel protein [Streptomyces sp. H27-H1]|uniref:chloride channel protein n=1 Tax=Streptomyces sp. H27-H1 TaxID=2996461 RepID=UPI002270B58B|nr:chloride channel protein [Streptomyces sp. H27-H1]MCY0932341.1 chloride channel protein [Streptomyces sp. H27-H1]